MRPEQHHRSLDDFLMDFTCPRLLADAAGLYCRDVRQPERIDAMACATCVWRHKKPRAGLRASPDGTQPEVASIATKPPGATAVLEHVGPGRTGNIAGAGRAEAPSWDVSQPSRGLGDVIAKATRAIGIKPCGGCKQRQAWLNKVWFFRRRVQVSHGLPRVGYLMPNFPLGGVGRSIVSTIEASRRLQFSGLAILSADNLYRPFADRIETHCPIVMSAQPVIEESDVVIVWGFVGDSGKLGQLDFQGKRVVAVAHGSCGFTNKQLGAVLPVATHYMAVSEAARRAFPIELQHRVWIIPNGVNPDDCRPRQSRSAVRRIWGIDDCRRLVGYIGRIAEDKNPLAVCAAVGALDEEYQAVIVGSGSSLAQHQTLAAELCGDRVRFVPPMGHVGDALGAIDCWLNASPAEGNCLGLIEAWMAGVPVVSTVTGAIPEHEAAAGCELIERVPNPPVPAELAEAVRRACSSHGRRRAAIAQSFALEHLGAEKMAQQFETMIETMLNDKR